MRIATIISAWEPKFVRRARIGGSPHIAARCVNARELAPHLPSIDAVMVGADVPWLDGAAVRFWHRAGIAVIGVGSNRAEKEILGRLGCDAVFDPEVDPTRVLATGTPGRQGAVVSVGGPRGAPGRTEIALGLAWAAADHARVLLVEADGGAPSLGLRLGLPPTTDLKPVRSGPIDLVISPPAWGPLATHVLDRVILAAGCAYDLVVIDAGTEPATEVLVVQPTPVGVVRAARMLEGRSEPPLLVANRVETEEHLRGIRAATGLEPDAVVGFHRPPAERPHPSLVDSLGSLAWTLLTEEYGQEVGWKKAL